MKEVSNGRSDLEWKDVTQTSVSMMDDKGLALSLVSKISDVIELTDLTKHRSSQDEIQISEVW